MNALLVLALTASMIVLRTGDRIPAEGPVKETDGVVMFRSGGLLYSVPASEVERIEEAAGDGEEKPVRRLRVSEEERKRLIAELEKNHSGQPAPAPQAMPAVAVEVTPEPAERREDEGWWRSQSRMYEENVRQAQEHLELLESRVEALRDQIRTFVILGYRPPHFTYQSSQLVLTEEQIPYARLEIRRAERALQQFREDARRAGVLPGWLR